MLRFGWVNASYIVGLELLSTRMRQCIGQLVPWDDFVRSDIDRILEETEAEAVFDNAD